MHLIRKMRHYWQKLSNLVKAENHQDVKWTYPYSFVEKHARLSFGRHLNKWWGDTYKWTKIKCCSWRHWYCWTMQYAQKTVTGWPALCSKPLIPTLSSFISYCHNRTYMTRSKRVVLLSLTIPVKTLMPRYELWWPRMTIFIPHSPHRVATLSKEACLAADNKAGKSERSSVRLQTFWDIHCIIPYVGTACNTTGSHLHQGPGQ